MPISFKLTERLAGFAARTAKKDETVDVIFRQMIGPHDAELNSRLEQIHGCLFSKIPGLLHPSRIEQLVVVIAPDLSASAYVDELTANALMKPNRAVQAGELVYVNDIAEIDSVDIGLNVPDDSAFIIVNSVLWKRSLFFDFGPLLADVGPRDYRIAKALAQQLHLLYGLPAPQPLFHSGKTRAQAMSDALDQFRKLISESCNAESAYQGLFEQNPWILGASYGKLLRHVKMNDQNIPDFTALRAYDQFHDVIELKQPFLPLFRKDGNFSANFNDAWNQAERYINFCQHQRSYLFEQKGLRFENPRCLLVIGNNLTSTELKAIREKEGINRLITVMTYDQLLDQARHVFDLVVLSGEQILTAS